MTTAKVAVLCCDDGNDGRTYDRQFEAYPDLSRRRTLLRLGAVHPTFEDAQAALLSARRHGPMPRVVLIDDWLGGHRARHTAAPAGWRLMRWIRAEFGGDAPCCVLMSGRMTPTLAYAFCQAGGSHAIDTVRDAPAWRDRIDIVWRALDGERWNPTPSPPKVIFTTDELTALAHLEAGHSNEQIRQTLGWTSTRVSKVRRRIYDRLRACGLIEIRYGAALTTVLAEAALTGGAIWAPLHLQSPTT